MVSIAVATLGGLTDLGTICLHIASLWPHPPAVVEADPDGGRLAVRHDWDLRPGLVDLVAHVESHQSSQTPERSSERDPLDAVAHRLRNGVRIVVSPPNIEAVLDVMPGLARAITHLDRWATGDVLIDVGVVRPGSPARDVISAATRRIIVVRKEVDDIVALAHRRHLLESMGEWSVLTAGGRLRADEVMGAIKWPTLADLLPNDRKSSTRLRASLASMASSLPRDRKTQPI